MLKCFALCVYKLSIFLHSVLNTNLPFSNLSFHTSGKLIHIVNTTNKIFLTFLMTICGTRNNLLANILYIYSFYSILVSRKKGQIVISIKWVFEWMSVLLTSIHIVQHLSFRIKYGSSLVVTYRSNWSQTYCNHHQTKWVDINKITL